jgi:4'-phosphopantetheinyl transferase EntD
LDSPNWDRLLFSAKEAVYKAWFPLVGEWLDPQETEILFHPLDQTFTAILCRDGLIINGRPVRQINGRWTRKQGILATAVVVTSM